MKTRENFNKVIFKVMRLLKALSRAFFERLFHKDSNEAKSTEERFEQMMNNFETP